MTPLGINKACGTAPVELNELVSQIQAEYNDEEVCGSIDTHIAVRFGQVAQLSCAVCVMSVFLAAVGQMQYGQFQPMIQHPRKV